MSDDGVEDLAKEMAQLCSELLVDRDEDLDAKLMCFLEGIQAGGYAAPVCSSRSSAVGKKEDDSPPSSKDTSKIDDPEVTSSTCDPLVFVRKRGRR